MYRMGMGGLGPMFHCVCVCVPCVLLCADYHPDKHERMKAVFRYYVQKDMLALSSFPGGSEPGT